jgi:hypothetical protein
VHFPRKSLKLNHLLPRTPATNNMSRALPNMAIHNRHRHPKQYENDKSAPATIATPSPSDPTSPMIVRIFHYAPPDLSYDVQIRPLPLRKSKSTLPWSSYDLASELALFSFPTTTFSFNNFGPFSHFIAQQTPANIALITKVQWEAQTSGTLPAGLHSPMRISSSHYFLTWKKLHCAWS